MLVSVSRCVATQVAADSTALQVAEVRARVHLVPGDDDNAIAVDTGIAVETAANKQIAVRIPVDSVAGIAVRVAVRSSGVDNPADYTVIAVYILVVVAPVVVL